MGTHSSMVKNEKSIVVEESAIVAEELTGDTGKRTSREILEAMAEEGVEDTFEGGIMTGEQGYHDKGANQKRLTKTDTDETELIDNNQVMRDLKTTRKAWRKENTSAVRGLGSSASIDNGDKECRRQ